MAAKVLSRFHATLRWIGGLLTILRLAAKLLTDYRQHTAVLAAHVRETRDVIETVEARNAQHNTSNFSINERRS